MPQVRVTHGLPDNFEVGSYTAVSSSGSMSKGIFYDYLIKVVLPFFPKCKKGKLVRDKEGNIVHCPLIMKVNTGPGRLGKCLTNVQRRIKVWEVCIMILLGLPN